MRRWAIRLAAVLTLAGCKNLDRDRDRDRSAEPASRTKTPNGKRWVDGPNPGLDEVGTPKADTWADPASPGYDLARDNRGILAGWVEDPDGRKVRDAFIAVEPVGGGAGGAEVGVQTGKDGHFLIRGLKPRQAYQLTVRMTLDGKPYGGQVWVQTGQPRSQHVRLTLIEGLTIPAAGRPAAGGKPATEDRPPAGGLPAPTLPAPTATAPGGDAWSPVPPAADPTRPPTRPDLQTQGDPGLPRPPVINIPSGPPPTVPPLPPANRSQYRTQPVPKGNQFTLLDPTGDARTVPSGKAGELILLDFLTTRCLPCKQFAPAVTRLQSEYGTRGLEVIGVTCDEADEPQRRAVAGQYQRAERLNYLLYVEPGRHPGAVMRRFNVEAFPTLVLLDAAGEVLWHGHPKDAADLEQVIARELSRR
jgi:thiol-disulfide isomerase/thioredoxin